jgi:hypothetical protein
MNEIDHLKKFVLCSGDVDHLHVNRIHLVGFSNIVIEDSCNKVYIFKTLVFCFYILAICMTT